ncbi:4570_t:CDS:2 [Scutellospora calospora]|uniref:4570_t:CDS:1 n=1 Tax=Scutellospora calospora TaxID=85575 RepID=A0ACA9KA04_9GLOM|nr:4570_t:CDS:2 [Scutellospora calospora]
MTKQLNKLFKENYIETLQCDSFEADSTILSSNSYKYFSKRYNKFMVLSKIYFSQNNTIKDFINDLRQYRKVELHENILKFIGIIKQNSSTHEIIFIHEYANDGTLRQYLNQNFCILNWNDKLILAKQLVKVAVSGTPKKYVKIYTDCWRYGSSLRPTIQNVFKDLNNINYNYDEIITESIKNKEHKENSILKNECSNKSDLLQHYTDLRYEIIKELEIISSIILTLKKIPSSEDSINSSLLIPKIFPSSLISNNLDDNNLVKFLFDLNNLFISQINIQGISEVTSYFVLLQLLDSFMNMELELVLII